MYFDNTTTYSCVCNITADRSIHNYAGRAGLPIAVQLVGANSSQGQGELQYNELGWGSVCSGGIGVIEAQMICQDLGFSFFSSIGTVNE